MPIVACTQLSCAWPQTRTGLFLLARVDIWHHAVATPIVGDHPRSDSALTPVNRKSLTFFNYFCNGR